MPPAEYEDDAFDGPRFIAPSAAAAPAPAPATVPAPAPTAPPFTALFKPLLPSTRGSWEWPPSDVGWPGEPALGCVPSSETAMPIPLDRFVDGFRADPAAGLFPHPL